MNQSGPLHESRSFERDYEGTTASLRAARDDVSAWLRAGGCDDEMAQRAVLVTSELASNAVQAAPDRRYAVSIMHAGTSLVELTVRSSFLAATPPERAYWFPTTPSAPRGRGLSIVAALSHDVRVAVDSEHVRVTAILPTAAPDP
jgi:anti-sigma regulatory factor (Ser/Thr protein kinase)